MSPTVLVVEDDEMLRNLIVEALSMLGVLIIDCANADEAMTVLNRSSPIALVITDVCMPGTMDGWELAKQIWSRWPSLPVVVTSGNRNVPDGALPLNAMFIPKPYTLDLLLQATRNYI
ncbi:response regulator [Pseudomonas sp. GZD-222]|uniref:response regulator n=1 Tax=Pseudomonas sp. GZD-222 TaxID=3404805 RepID=UPI003BB7C6DE